MYDFIKAQGHASHFPAAMCCHQCGLFAVITVGLSYGKGQTAPTWLDNKEHTALAQTLLANKDIIQMANFASCVFSLVLFFFSNILTILSSRL
jgi:transposase